jgi:RimJ/RimL family protein N-acetyltransferase
MVATLVLFIGALRPSVMLWTIEHENRPIGLSLIRQIDRRNGRATVAVLIGERSEQRKGLAAEAATIRNDFVFGRLGLETLQGTTWSQNLASRRLLERSGYRLIGTPREDGGGRIRDLLVFELTRSSYERPHASGGLQK